MKGLCVQVEAFAMSLLDTADMSDPAGPAHALLSPRELVYCQARPREVGGSALRLRLRSSQRQRAQEYFVAHGLPHAGERARAPAGRLPGADAPVRHPARPRTPSPSRSWTGTCSAACCTTGAPWRSGTTGAPRCRVLLAGAGQTLKGKLRRLDTAEFQKGDLYIVRYKPVQELLRENWIALI